MNWKKIERKYTKVVAELKKAGLLASTTDERKWVFFGNHIRVLYDFFDDNGIIIIIGYDNDGMWTCYVCGGDKKYYHIEPFKNRSKAENCGYKNAFKILEEKLSK